MFIVVVMRRRGNNHVDVHFWRTRPVFFLLKVVKTRSMKEKVDGKAFISRQIGLSCSTKTVLNTICNNRIDPSNYPKQGQIKTITKAIRNSKTKYNKE